MRRKTQPYWNVSVREERRIEGLAPTLTNQRGLKGATLGPASAGRRLSREERRVIEEKMRRDGTL